MYNSLKTYREWDLKIHSNLWCLCCDVQKPDHVARMVVKVSHDPKRLYLLPKEKDIYLVNPKGERIDN